MRDALCCEIIDPLRCEMRDLICCEMRDFPITWFRQVGFDRLVSTSSTTATTATSRNQPQQPQPTTTTTTTVTISTLNQPRKCSGTIVTLNHHHSITSTRRHHHHIFNYPKKNKLFQVSVIEPVEITLTLLDDHYRHVSPNKSNNALK